MLKCLLQLNGITEIDLYFGEFLRDGPAPVKSPLYGTKFNELFNIQCHPWAACCYKSHLPYMRQVLSEESLHPSYHYEISLTQHTVGI